jgi:hypothetical protein
MAEDKTEENIVVLPESGNIIARRKYSPSKCIHNRRKDTCIPCHGNSVCIHNKVKRICKDCKGVFEGGLDFGNIIKTIKNN